LAAKTKGTLSSYNLFKCATKVSICHKFQLRLNVTKLNMTNRDVDIEVAAHMISASSQITIITVPADGRSV